MLTQLTAEFVFEISSHLAHEDEVEVEDEVEFCLTKMARKTLAEFNRTNKFPVSVLTDDFWSKYKPVALGFLNERDKKITCQKICHNAFLVRDMDNMKLKFKHILTHYIEQHTDEKCILFDTNKHAVENLDAYCAQTGLTEQCDMLQDFIHRCKLVNFTAMGVTKQKLSYEDFMHLTVSALDNRALCFAAHTTFLKALKGIFAPSATKAITLNDANVSFALGGTEHAKVVIYDDITWSGTQNMNSVFRHIVDGNDVVTVARKGNKFRDIEFPPLLITSNITVESIPEGIRTRIIVISVSEMVDGRRTYFLDNKPFKGFSHNIIAVLFAFSLPYTYMGTVIQHKDIQEAARSVKHTYMTTSLPLPVVCSS